MTTGNRKEYKQGAAREFRTRAEAQQYIRENRVEYIRIERRYAPQSPNSNDDGYVCVIRIQGHPFGPINDQREYI